MTHQTLNETRGEQRAADLRRRFRHVSDASFGRRQFGIWPSSSGHRLKTLNVQHRRNFNEFAVWGVMAGVILFAGLTIFNTFL